VSVPERDPSATARRLEQWLTEVAGLEDVDVGDISIPGTTGWSNETILFDAQWREGGVVGGHELVARIAPSAYSVFPDDTFTAQYEIMSSLGESTEVPIALVHWFEPSTEWFGQPFWIMARVAGDIPADTPPYASSGWLHEASAADQERAWWSGIEAMARVHQVDLALLESCGLDRPADPLAAQLDLYERFLTWAEDGEPHELARHALDVLRSTAPAGPPEGPTLTWGDARLSNLIYREFEVAAVLDWEMASICDPLLELGWWLFADDALTRGSGCERLPGFPSRDATAERWSALTGRSTAALGYYELLAGLRFTVIMLRMGKLLQDIGLVPATFAYDNLISQALAAQLDERGAGPSA
jgi:aminoglycoside phosphotransferase (APT) family kinase protein